MFITTDSKEVALDYPIDNREGHLEVAIHEMFYRVKWFNISTDKKNNWIKRFKGNQPLDSFTLNDGYYGFCELKEELEDGYDISLEVSNANLRVTLKFKPEVYEYRFAKKLATILGFEENKFNIRPDNYIFEGENPLDLEVNSPLYVYLEETSTTENLWNGRPSNLLRVIPSTESASFCKHEVKSFPNPQYKKLINKHIDRINIRITDIKGNEVHCDGLIIVLEIK